MTSMKNSSLILDAAQQLQISGMFVAEPTNMRMAVNFIFACSVAFLLLVTLTGVPEASIFAVDLLFCAYLSSLFRKKIRYVFLLHPFILLFSDLFYSAPFLELGDGGDYQLVVAQYGDFGGFSSIFESLTILDALKYMSLGVAPIFDVPPYLYGAPDSGVYYLWQGCFYVMLVAACVTLAKSWRVISSEYLLLIALFSVVSPSFYDMGVAPTRHFVTYISVFLFYVSFVATYQKFSLFRLICVIFSLILVVVSKFPLIIPILIFSVYYAFFEQGVVSTSKKLLVILALIGSLAIGYDSFIAKLIEYSEISSIGAASFSGLVGIPVLGIFFKYLYALLAPFPWQNAMAYIDTIYGGNGFLFFMHMLSSLSGIYFFARLILYGKPLLTGYPAIRPPIVYGLIMSASILFGATGFHVYLLIYFPFFAPLLAVKRYQISIMFPVFFVILVEGAYTALSL